MTDTPTSHDLARQIAAMRTELREIRRLVEQLATQPTTTTTDTASEGVQHLPNGAMFLPGTGTIR